MGRIMVRTRCLKPNQQMQTEHRIEIRNRKFETYMLLIFMLLMVPIFVSLVYNGIQRGGIVSTGLALGIAFLVVFVIAIYIRARRRSVKALSTSGVLLADGSMVPPNNLIRVVDKMVMLSPTRRGIWRTELQFTGGRTAWLIPNKISNFDEVHAYVRSLPCEQKEEVA
jgi:hypothetical protein